MKSQLDYNAKIRLKRYPTRNDTIITELATEPSENVS